MSATILEARGETIRVEVSVNGSKSPGVKVLHLDGDGILVAESVAILDVEKRAAWLARLAVEHGGKLAAEIREMILPLAAQVIDVLAKKGAPVEEGVPELEPWPDPVDGATLLGDIEAAVRRFLVMQRQEHYTAVALWAVFAHAHDAFRFSPILIASSPEKGSGKTRLLEVLSFVAPNAWMTVSPSDAVVFRKIDQEGPTFLLDEGDNIQWKERKELLSLFNSGYQRRTARTSRMVGEGASLATADFSTWTPKALSCLKVPLPDTTVSRSIVIPFKKATRAEPVEKLRERTALAVFGPLHQRAARWAADNLEALRLAEPASPDFLSDRTADAWEPLLAIADLVGGGWPERTRTAATHFAASVDDTESTGAKLLRDIREVFTDREADRLPTKEIVDALNAREDRQWAEWSHGRGISSQSLAHQLKPFGIKPNTRRSGDDVYKGYLKADFKDAWHRYVPAEPVAGRVTDDVTGTEAANSLGFNTCNDVTGNPPLESKEVLI